MKRKIFLILLFTAAAALSSFADGGGGMFFGYQTSQYPFLEKHPVVNNSYGLVYFGGYGYGIDRKGNITGGFGIAIQDPSFEEGGISGGFGGFISGYRIFRRPVSLSLVTWTGFGGIYTGDYNSEDGGNGFFSLFFEIDAELGLPITPWFMPVVYVGYQVIGNMIPGEFFTHFLSYTPVLGIRVCWGKV